MTCNVCTNHDAATLQRIQAMYLEQGMEPEKIAVEYSIRYEDMRKHLVTCIEVKKSRFERLTALIDDLGENLEVSKLAYQSDTNRSDLAHAYTGMAQQLRMTIESAQSLVKPEDTVGELINLVLNPFIRQAVIATTEEISKLKDELVSQGANEEQVLRASKARLKAIAAHLRRATNSAVSNLNNYYGVTVQHKAVQFETQLADAEEVVMAEGVH